MDFVDVPVVYNPAVRIDQCIGMLAVHKVGGLVCLIDRRSEIVYMRHLLEAADSNLTLLSEISGYPIRMMSPGAAARFGFSTDPASEQLGAFEALFGSQLMEGVDYAAILTNEDRYLVADESELLTIVTRNEGFGLALRTTGGFMCNGSPTHYFPDPHVSEGQTCPESPECTRKDGRTPTIVRRF